MKLGGNLALAGVLVLCSCCGRADALAARRKDGPRGKADDATNDGTRVDDDVGWLLSGPSEARLGSLLSTASSLIGFGGSRDSDANITELGRSIGSTFWALDQKLQECKTRPLSLRATASEAVIEVQEAAGALSQIRGKLLQAKSDLPESWEWRRSLQTYQAHSSADCKKVRVLQAEEDEELRAEARRLAKLEAMLKGQCSQDRAATASLAQSSGRQWPKGEVCARARDTLDELQGELKDKVERLRAEQEESEKACQSESVFWDGQENLTIRRQEKIASAREEASQLLGNATKDTLAKARRRGSLTAKVLSVEKSCHEEILQLLEQIAKLRQARAEKAKELGKEAPQDCEVTEWMESPCSVSCGGGSRFLTRQVLMPAANGGTCRPLQLQQACADEECPRDCALSTWSSWSSCSAECDGGFQERRRNITVQPQGDGVPCSNLVSSRPCNSRACERDCLLADWSDWSSCSMPCNGGTEHRQRKVAEPPLGSGFCPSSDSEVRLARRPCNPEACTQAVNTSSCRSIHANLVLLVDNSASIGQDLLGAFREVAGELTKRLPLSPSQAKVAVASFSDHTTLVSKLSPDQQGLQSSIGSKLKWGEGASLLGRGLALAETLLETGDSELQTVATAVSTAGTVGAAAQAPESDGAAAEAEGATETETETETERAQTVVVFTDGRISDAFVAQQAALRLRRKSIRLVFVVVGRSKEASTGSSVFRLASAPTEENLLFFPDRTEFTADPPSMAGKVLERTCYDLQD